MKRRHGFVSNSSSSSFLILKSRLTDQQIANIYNYKKVAERKVDYVDDTPWHISEGRDYIGGKTDMDNFDMLYFLTSLNGVLENDIQWDSDDFQGVLNDQYAAEDRLDEAEKYGPELWRLMNEELQSEGLSQLVYKILKKAKSIQAQLKKDGNEGG